MQKIIVMVGISASGKTTKANQLQKEIESSVIISRDKLREMLFGYDESTISEYYQKTDLYKFESQITSFQDCLIKRALAKGKSVILDNTHLKQKYINAIAKDYSQYPISFELVECDLSVALERDKARTRSVGKDVINMQFQSLNILKKNFNFKEMRPFEIDVIKQDASLPEAFIFDIDGTLAKMEGRSPYDLSRVGEDSLNESVATCLHELSAHHEIIICSGREGTQQCQDLTIEWLDKHGLEYKWLLMRKEGDMRADYVVKEEMWRKIVKDYHVVGQFDDRQQVVDHARKLGFTVFQVDYGDF